MSDPSTLMQELEDAARALDKASTRLAGATREFEGWSEQDEHGKWHWQPGPQLLYEEKVDAECVRIYEAAQSSEEKPPPEPIRLAMARSAVKTRHPDLAADYHRLASEIRNIQRWCSAKRDTISARQSVLSAEKAILGTPRQAA